MSHFKVKSRKLKEKYCRIFACNMIHSLKLAQTDAFQLFARESVFSLRQAQFFFEYFISLPLRVMPRVWHHLETSNWLPFTGLQRIGCHWTDNERGSLEYYRSLWGNQVNFIMTTKILRTPKTLNPPPPSLPCPAINTDRSVSYLFFQCLFLNNQTWTGN